VVQADAAPAASEAETVAPGGPTEKPRRSRRARSGGEQQATTDAPAEAPVAVELPPLPAHEPRAIDPEATAHLLDSVLDALPAKPQTATRPRRRVTTAALTGTAVSPEESQRSAGS
jgi:ribonuclease E